MDAATFIDRYPEFEPAADLVDATLAEVAGNLSVADFGDRYDEAHGLLTADALWRSPFGLTLRLDSDGKKSEYRIAFERLTWEFQAHSVGVSKPLRGW